MGLIQSIRENIKEKFLSLIRFLKEAKIELKKVTWPSKRDTLGSTYVVIIVVFLIAIFLGLVDFGLSRILKLLLG